jgi:hypothetical protein
MSLTKDDVEVIKDRLLAGILDELDERFNELLAKIEDSVPEGPRIKFATHRYLQTGPIPVVDFYDLQDGPYLNRQSEYPLGAETYRYVTTVCRPTDDLGWTQFAKPDELRPFVATVKGTTTPVTRPNNGGEFLLNLHDDNLMALILARLTTRVDEFEGLYLDEVDQTWLWGYPKSGLITQYPDLADWRAALLRLVGNLHASLVQLGKKLWINLGADYDISNPWQSALVNVVHAVNIEHFVGREKVAQPPTTGQDWQRQVAFVEAVELLGKAVHVHASTSGNQKVVDFAFVSWLLATQFHGSFSASLDYPGSIIKPSTTLEGNARQLGAPAGRPVQYGSSGSTWKRAFQGGTVYVNPTLGLLDGMPAQSGRIVLA